MRFLITGCTGFLGERLTKRLLDQGHEVVGMARNEGQIVKYKQKFPEAKIILGDIADKWVVKKSMRFVDGVYHLAATKSVDIAEKQPYQTIKTNIIGTQNILQESYIAKPSFVLFISTDKAAQVSGVYGATKMLGEALFREAQEMNPVTRYLVVRYGNVLWSTGSVLTKWKDLIEQGKGVKITDPEMTRFFWTPDQAIDHIFECQKKSNSPAPFVPDMKAMKMGDLLEAMLDKYGKVSVEIIGNRGGENMHETIDGKIFSNTVPKYTKKEILELL